MLGVNTINMAIEAEKLRHIAMEMQSVISEVSWVSAQLKCNDNVFDRVDITIHRLKNRMNGQCNGIRRMADVLAESQKMYEKTEQEVIQETKVPVYLQRVDAIDYQLNTLLDPFVEDEVKILYAIRQPDEKNLLRKVWIDDWFAEQIIELKPVLEFEEISKPKQMISFIPNDRTQLTEQINKYVMPLLK